MKKLVLLTSLVLAVFTAKAVYEPSWDSLDARPVPRWWREAKFGIFVHWGPYSVPAYAPTGSESVYDGYAEWYQGRLLKGYEKFLAYHKAHYGAAPYGNLAARFTAENFDPAAWAELFKKAGAKYVVLTSKHHDGYALWPSPESAYYNSTVLGSGRDLAGEFTAAMKAAGLRSGFYYSLLEYANPLYPASFVKRPDVTPLTMREWARRINLPQMKELAENYKADIIWTDGEWDFSDKDQLAEEFLAWLYNESSVKDDVVVNDRWGSGAVRGHHGGHYTTEYAFDGGDQTGLSDIHPWEECRGIGHSFGYNRFETVSDYMSREKCLETLVQIVSAGGNLLLNVGPTADGRIPAIMEDRLLAIGRWLAVNGEAIYATTRATKAAPPAKGSRLYLTQKGDDLYVIIFGGTGEPRVIAGVKGAIETVSLVGSSAPVAFTFEGDTLRIRESEGAPWTRSSAVARVYKVTFKSAAEGAGSVRWVR